MPRVDPLPESAWTDEHREVLARLAGGHPGDDPLLATLLHVPNMAEAVMPMTRYVLDASTLSPSHRLLLALRTASLERCPAVWAMVVARAKGQDVEVKEPLPASSGGGDRASRSLLRLADELVRVAAVTDATWGDLADEHETTWLMDAVETVAHVSFLCCLAGSFGVPQPGRGAEPAWPGPPRGRDRRPARRRAPLAAARIEPVDGDEIAVLRTFARHPVMAQARRPRADYVNRRSPLTPHDRELLILRIGWDLRSRYEWAKHVGSVGRARDHGVDPELVVSGPGAAGVSDHDALLMRVADDLHHDSMVSSRTWTTLVEDYDLSSAMSAVFTASSYRSTSMSLNAYGVQPDPGDESFPAAG